MLAEIWTWRVDSEWEDRLTSARAPILRELMQGNLRHLVGSERCDQLVSTYEDLEKVRVVLGYVR